MSDRTVNIAPEFDVERSMLDVRCSLDGNANIEHPTLNIERPMSMPAPRIPITIREAMMDDLPFIDSLQKRHNKMVGFMHEKTLRGKIELGHVVIAEEPSPLPSPGVPGEGERVGYCIGNDKYFKHENVGVIYQLNVVPGKQRNL